MPSKASSPRGPRAAPAPTSSAWVALDLHSPVPVYQQLYSQIARAVSHGTLPEGTLLPSARRLSASLGIHYHTVNKSYQMLRRDGFLSLNHRKQVEARRPREPGAEFLSEWTERQRQLLADASAQGLSSPEVLRRIRDLLDPRSRSEAARGA